MSQRSASHGVENAATNASGKARAVLTTTFCAFAALLPFVGVVAPKGVVVLLLLTAVLAVPACWRAQGRFPVPDPRVAIVLGLLVVWCAVASSWSFDVTRSLVLALRIAVIFAAGAVLFSAAAALDDTARARVGRWLVGGVVVTLALMAAEIGLGYPLLHSFDVASAGSELVWFNRGAIAMALIVWPLTAYLWGRGIGWKALVVPVLLGVASVFLESAAATLGLAVGGAGALLIVSHRKVGRIVTIAAAVVIFGAMPFATRQMHDHGWHRADWLAGSAQHRVEIWNFSAGRIAEKPLLGWGFDSSRHIGERFAAAVAAGEVDDAGEAGRGAVSLHPHNTALQIMLELGAVGAAIALALLLPIALRLDKLPSRTREFGQVLFIAALAIGCVAFGIWQNWWLSLLVSVALLVPLTATRATSDSREQGASAGPTPAG